MDEFQDLSIQFGQVLKAKTFNRCRMSLVGLSGTTVIKKKLGKENLESFCVMGFKKEIDKHETGPHQMAEAQSEEKVVRRRYLARY